MIKAIIFDFDGVIIEATDVKANAFAEIYRPYGDEIAQKVADFHRKNGGMSRFEKFRYFHRHFLNKSISDKQLHELADIFSAKVVDLVLKIPLVKCLPDFLKAFSDKYKFFVSSGTPENELNYILQKRNLSVFFTQIYGSPSKKKDHIMQIFDRFDLLPYDVIFVGDSPKDKQTAIETGVNFVARLTKFNYDYFENELFAITDFCNFVKIIQKVEMNGLIA